MAHQVLARKWRPRTFADVAGQQHVVRALSNALQQQRLHHAYLLTGTRGVGKTTLARLLAKGLNCETGMTCEPCLTCNTCLAIEQGQFIDLIEIDAASRTRVEDTRDLLDNVQYMPTIGRYKVYLIDEVHMLSNHSFNALLKTLEEPPAHAIFILATTDPERLPATVLSRCLQFQLKAMTPEQIIQRLDHILTVEQFAFTAPALAIIAQAAQGSMRDALSLLDQVIALGQGQVTEQAALDLLGGITTESILQLLQAIALHDGVQALAMIQNWLSDGIDFQQAQEMLIECLHQISLVQVIPQAGNTEQMLALTKTLATLLSKEQTQLYYQIALHGKRDLAYAPTPRLGFEMTVLRMLAFSPMAQLEMPVANKPAMLVPSIPVAATVPEKIIPKPAAILEPMPSPIAAIAAEPSVVPAIDWALLLPQLGLAGANKVLAEHCILKNHNEQTFELTVDASHRAMLTTLSQEKLTQALTNYYKKPICVKIDIGSADLPTPANLVRQRNKAILNEAEQSLLQDPNLQTLLKRFDASIESGSIKPNLTEEYKNET